jgi:hypothetical protein
LVNRWRGLWGENVVRSFLTKMAIVASFTVMCAYGAAAQQTHSLAARASPAIAAQANYEWSVSEYRKCLAENASNAKPCEGLRHIMDASALVLSGLLAGRR